MAQSMEMNTKKKQPKNQQKNQQKNQYVHTKFTQKINIFSEKNQQNIELKFNIQNTEKFNIFIPNQYSIKKSIKY